LFRRDVSLILVTRIATLAIGVLIQAVVARVLGPQGKGQLSLIFLLVSMTALLGNGGIGIANVYFIGRKKYELQEILGNSLLAAVVSGPLLTLAFCTASPYLRETFLNNEVDQLLLILASLAIPFILANQYLTNILLGLLRIARMSLVTIFQSLSLFLFYLAFMVVLDLGLKGAVMGSVLSFVSGTALAIFLLREDVQIRPMHKKGLLIESITFGLKGQVGNILQFFNYRLDYFLVSLLAGVTNLGFYATAVTLAEFIWYIPNALATVLFPTVAAADEETAKDFTPRVCRHTILIGVATGLGMFLASRYLIILIYTESFLPSLYPLWVLLPGIIVLGWAKIMTSDLAGRGKPHYNSLVAAISLVVTLLLDLGLIPRSGIVGAATASSLAYTLSAVLAAYAYLRISGASWWQVLIPQKSDLMVYLDSSRKAISYARRRALLFSSRD